MMVTHCMLRTIVESVMIKDEYDDFCEDDVNDAYDNHPYRPHHLHHNHHYHHQQQQHHCHHHYDHLLSPVEEHLLELIFVSKGTPS